MSRQPLQQPNLAVEKQVAQSNALRLFATLALSVCLLSGPADGQPSVCDPEHFIVVIDVGHSEQAPGALSAHGVYEFWFNLNLSRRIYEHLQRAGFKKALLMLTPGAGQDSLRRRTMQAKEAQADLFLSIHHDSIQDIYLQYWNIDGRNRPFSNRFSGYSLFVSHENRQFKKSLRFAEALGDELKRRSQTFSRHHAEQIRGEGRPIIDEERGIYSFDRLAVLRTAKMPAVLLEAGIIVNPKDDIELSSPDHQDLIGDAVASAVGRFCESTDASKQ